MKKSIALVVINIFCSTFAWASSVSYQSLIRAFDNAAPASQQELTGAFIGDCYDKPSLANNGHHDGVIGDTMPVLLLGRLFPDGFRVGLLSPNTDADGEVTPGSGVAEFKKSFEKNGDAPFFDILHKYFFPVKNSQPIDGSFVSSGEDTNGMRISNYFRKDSSHLISEEITTGPNLPPYLAGIQFVCFWFQRIE